MQQSRLKDRRLARSQTLWLRRSRQEERPSLKLSKTFTGYPSSTRRRRGLGGLLNAPTQLYGKLHRFLDRITLLTSIPPNPFHTPTHPHTHTLPSHLSPDMLNVSREFGSPATSVETSTTSLPYLDSCHFDSSELELNFDQISLDGSEQSMSPQQPYIRGSMSSPQQLYSSSHLSPATGRRTGTSPLLANHPALGSSSAARNALLSSSSASASSPSLPSIHGFNSSNDLQQQQQLQQHQQEAFQLQNLHRQQQLMMLQQQQDKGMTQQPRALPSLVGLVGAGVSTLQQQYSPQQQCPQQQQQQYSQQQYPQQYSQQQQSMLYQQHALMHQQRLSMSQSANPLRAHYSPEGLPVSSDGFVYQVQFKRSYRNFALHPSGPRSIQPGDFVRVEADRGEDLGVVLAKISETEFRDPVPTAGYRGRGFFSGHNERKWLLRMASVTERLQIRDKVQDEEDALRVICDQVAIRGLPMIILDVEYQFDRHKLVFFFEADRRIDFRDLVQELFSMYKTRIWMQQVDTTRLSDEDPGAVLAKQSGLLPDRGTHLNLPPMQSYFPGPRLNNSPMSAAGHVLFSSDSRNMNNNTNAMGMGMAMGMGLGPDLFFSPSSPSSASGSALGSPSYAFEDGARGTVSMSSSSFSSSSSGGGDGVSSVNGSDYANGRALMTTWSPSPSHGGGGVPSPSLWRSHGQQGQQGQHILSDPPGLGPSSSAALTFALAQDQHFRSLTSPSTVEVRPSLPLPSPPLSPPLDSLTPSPLAPTPPYTQSILSAPLSVGRVVQSDNGFDHDGHDTTTDSLTTQPLTLPGIEKLPQSLTPLLTQYSPF